MKPKRATTKEFDKTFDDGGGVSKMLNPSRARKVNKRSSNHRPPKSDQASHKPTTG